MNFQNIKSKAIEYIVVVIITLVIFALIGINKEQTKVIDNPMKDGPLLYEDYLEMDENGWYPGKTDEDDTYQVMPEITGQTSHDRFKELANKYKIDAGIIREVENEYKIREGMLLCIMIAETSGGTRGYARNGCYNVGNVGNNDRGDRVCYDTFTDGVRAIGRALNNQYLGGIQTLGCLSNAGNCVYDDNSHRYATSNGNWERTITHCLNSIYEPELGPIDPTRFNVRRWFLTYQ